LEKAGFSLYTEPEGGMFVWAKKKGGANMVEIANRAARQGMVLAPGNLFRSHQEPSEWMRFNSASCDDPAIFQFLGSG